MCFGGNFFILIMNFVIIGVLRVFILDSYVFFMVFFLFLLFGEVKIIMKRKVIIFGDIDCLFFLFLN